MRRLLCLIAALCAIMLAACSARPDRIEEQISRMTLREKVGQLFIVRKAALDSTVAEAYPIGGVILFASNIIDEEQLTRLTADLHAWPGQPLVCIDEEGGRVARIGRNPHFHVPRVPSMAQVATLGHTRDAYEAGNTIGTYLREYGIDINFAPVADVNTNPHNIVIGDRAFSDDPSLAAPMVAAYLKGLQKAGTLGCLKHFPGHGDTQADTHYGYAVSTKTWEQIDACEMIPFRAGIKAGAELVMTAHISLPNVTQSEIPSTLSPVILQDKLRGELGFRGVIVTDALDMGAISRQYSMEEACLLAIKAGADMLLCVNDYPRVIDSLLEAVQQGEITEERIDESVRRILRLRELLNN